MCKIAERWQITVVKTSMIDSGHDVELAYSSLNQIKVKWYVTFKGDFYTEFTFNNRPAAEKMYDSCLGSEIFMDVVAKNRGDK